VAPLTDQVHAVERQAASVAHLRPLTEAENRDMEEHSYIVIRNLVQRLVRNRASLTDVELQRFFDEVELQAETGIDDVRELVAEGIMEDLQNSSAAVGLPDDAWLPYMGPKTQKLWRVVRICGLEE
jgi:hypothetical protein